VRELLVVLHAGRETNRRVAAAVAKRLADDGIRLRVLADEWAEVDNGSSLPPGMEPKVVDGTPACAAETEAVLVLGGDGTLLRAADLARAAQVPLLGVNLGHVGFLAEAEQESLDEALAALVDKNYQVEERMTVDAAVRVDGEIVARTWALNEAVVEKGSRERILEVVLEVDGRPVSAFGCDGVICATPTGSTAYAFSAGGPLIWPQVEALLLAPSNAHALFARPMVISPDSEVAIEIAASGPREGPGPDGAPGGSAVRRPAGPQVRPAGPWVAWRPGRGSLRRTSGCSAPGCRTRAVSCAPCWPRCASRASA
jgi:NAD+ kinase